MREMVRSPSMPIVRYLPEPELIPPCPGCGDRTRVVAGYLALRPFHRMSANGAGSSSRAPTGTAIRRPNLGSAQPAEDSFSWTYPFDYASPVRQPWVWLLIDGRKTWELNHLYTKVRGPVGLSPAGSGAIAGMAELVDVHGPFTTAELRDHQERAQDRRGFARRICRRWAALRLGVPKGRRFERPVPYQHPHQRVIWVRLSVA